MMKEEYEHLLNDLEKCLFRACSIQLEFAPELIKMTWLEVENCFVRFLETEVADLQYQTTSESKALQQELEGSTLRASMRKSV